MSVFEVTCYLCDGKADLRKMTRYKGQYFHKVKVKGLGFKTSCLEAVKNNDKRKD